MNPLIPDEEFLIRVDHRILIRDQVIVVAPAVFIILPGVSQIVIHVLPPYATSIE